MLLETEKASSATKDWSHTVSLNRFFNSHGQVHRFIVTSDLTGWEVREEEDSTVLRRTHREDWHRVERDVMLFQIRATSLKGQGWSET